MTKNLYELLSFLSQPIPAPAAAPVPRPGYGLQCATVQPQAKSPYERTLRPGETRNLAELQDMLGEVILAAGSAAVPGVQGKAATRQTAARIRPGHEKQFGEWFGNSKARTLKGKPKDLYHGTNVEVKSYDPSRADVGALYGPGFYMTENPKIASGYASEIGKPNNVLKVHTVIKNPFDIDAPISKAVIESINKVLVQRSMEPLMPPSENPFLKSLNISEKMRETLLSGGNTWHRLERRLGGAGANEVLQAAGFDGITHVGGKLSGGEKHQVWIAFKPEQIKSATGNRGTYDPKSPRIDE